MSGITDTARALRKFIELAVQDRPDEEAVEFACLHPAWSGSGETVKAGTRIQYNGKLFTVLQTHMTQEDWDPESAPSLFAEVLVSEDGTVLPWKQPDSTNPYAKGDKVEHGGLIWISLIDGNVWEPGTAGTEALWAAEA